MNRRSLLAVMGLAPVGAIAADDVTNQKTASYEYRGKFLQEARYDPERVATALERLAAEIRANTCELYKFRIETDAISHEPSWLRQDIVIGVEFLIDPPQS